jgi:hypothetical protein
MMEKNKGEDGPGNQERIIQAEKIDGRKGRNKNE